MTLEERKQQAQSRHEQGYNCAQCVAMAFADKTGIPEDVLARISVGLGKGLAGTGQVCGAASAMGLVMGSMCQDKKEAYLKINPLIKQFAENKPGISCPEIKGHCMQWIEQCIEILDQELNEH